MKSIKNIKTRLGRLSIIFGLVAFASYSTSDALGKYSLIIKNIDYLSYLVVLNATGVVLSLVVGLKLHGVKLFKVAKSKIKYVALRTFFNSINVLGAVYAISKLPLEIFYSLIFTGPLLSTILAHFFIKEKITKKVSLALVLGFLGVIVVLQPWKFAEFSQSYFSGLIVASILPFCIANITILNRKYLHRVKPFTVIFYSAIAITILSIILVCFQSSKPTLNIAELKYPLIAGVFTFLGAYFFFMAFRLGKVQNVAITQYTQFMWAVLFGLLIFNHTPKLATYIGIVFVIGSNLLNLTKNHPKRNKKHG